MPATFHELLKFTPLYPTRVWGGRRLESVLQRTLPDDQPYGESWELVDREHEQSVVASGAHQGVTLHELWTQHQDVVFGPAYARHHSKRFPLLIKVLDCADELSIQVHPPVSLAAELGGEPKTEMWFVAHADDDARLFAGLRQGMTKHAFESALTTGEVANCVHEMHPQKGDSLFVPSGRLHALGRGLLIYEIQQNSDTTYRVFEWNRLGLDGKPRELHVEQSLKCIDFSDFEPGLQHHDGVLATCEHFTVTHTRTGHIPRGDTFRLIMAVQPTQWGHSMLSPGDVALKPACLAMPEPVGEWLEIDF